MITTATQPQYDYDPTSGDYDVLCAPASIRRKQKTNMSIFRHSHVVVVSQSNQTQIVTSITFVVVNASYHSRIIVELQL